MRVEKPIAREMSANITLCSAQSTKFEKGGREDPPLCNQSGVELVEGHAMSVHL